MKPLPIDSLKQLFTEARTYKTWLPDTVSDEDLKAIYELMKWGPTSANLCPARIVFLRNGPEKEKLIDCLFSENIDKVRGAPITAIIAQDLLESLKFI